MNIGKRVGVPRIEEAPIVAPSYEPVKREAVPVRRELVEVK